MKHFKRIFVIIYLIVIGFSFSGCQIRSANDPELYANDLSIDYDGLSHEIIPIFKGNGTYTISYSLGNSGSIEGKPIYPGTYHAYISFKGDDYTKDDIATASLTIRSPLIERVYENMETLYFPLFVDGVSTSSFNFAYNTSIKKIIFNEETSVEFINALFAQKDPFKNLMNLETVILPDQAVCHTLFEKDYTFINYKDNKQYHIIERDATYNLSKLEDYNYHFVFISHYSGFVDLSDNNKNIQVIIDEDNKHILPLESGKYFFERKAYKLIMDFSNEGNSYLNLDSGIIDLTNKFDRKLSIELGGYSEVCYRLKGEYGSAYNVDTTSLQGLEKPKITSISSTKFGYKDDIFYSYNDINGVIEFFTSEVVMIKISNENSSMRKWNIEFKKAENIEEIINENTIEVKMEKRAYYYIAKADGDFYLEYSSDNNFYFKFNCSKQWSDGPWVNTEIAKDEILYFTIWIIPQNDLIDTSTINNIIISIKVYEVKSSLTWYANGEKVANRKLEIHVGEEVQLSYVTERQNSGSMYLWQYANDLSLSNTNVLKALKPNYHNPHATVRVYYSSDDLNVYIVPDEPEFESIQGGFIFRLKTNFVETYDTNLKFNFGFTINNDRKVWNLLLSNELYEVRDLITNRQSISNKPVYLINEWQYFDLFPILKQLGLQDDEYIQINFKYVNYFTCDLDKNLERICLPYFIEINQSIQVRL